MNKTAIKNFAVWARVQLIESAKQRAYEYEITEDGENKNNVEAIGGRLLSNDEKDQRRQLITRIHQKGYAQVMEEAAYTWFNRFIALRFMEVNGYLPSKTRVFTDETGAFKPEIMKQAMSVELKGLDRNIVLKLIDSQANDDLYKYLLITQCNALNASLPTMFETIANWTELLFPNNLLRQDSVLGHMVSDIPEEDWQDAVQIIGWLYQYYNTELKDDTFAQLKKNVKITKERIPAATQLFTPDWIVRYMVENSLGRLWLEGHPNAELHDGWKYYLDEAKQEPEVEAQLAKLREEYKTIKPEEIKVIDPCMGSGHILVYAFDVLMQIYTSAGWDQREAAQSILKNNLFGLDIDDRAAQLAYFAVMMKARQYDRRLLTRGIQPNIYSIRESNGIQAMTIEYFHKNDPKLKADIERIVTEMRDAKEYGSILNITPVDFAGLYARFDDIRNDINMMQMSALDELLPLVKCAELLAQKYDVVVTNPPYMAVSNAGAKVNDYVKKNFPDSKADMFAVFIEHCGQMAKKNGHQAMITQHAWMFLSSFEKLRTKLLAVDIVNMAHLGARAFEEIGGEVVQTTSFVIRKSHIADYKGEYCRLIEPTSQQGKEDMFLAGENRYEADQSNFSKIPKARIGYWISNKMIGQFSKKPISKYADTRRGLQTGNSEKFIRKWYEVLRKKEALQLDQNTKKLPCKWFLFNSGGSFRRWYGNIIDVVNWEDSGRDIKNTGKAIIPSEDRYFDELISWNKISSGQMSVRYQPKGIIPGDASPFLHSTVQNHEIILYAMAMLNSKIAAAIVEVLSPTLNFEVGNIAEIPVVIDDNYQAQTLPIVNSCVEAAKSDWDSYETSWDFKRNPLV